MVKNVNVELLIRHVKLYRLRPIDSIIVCDIINQSRIIFKTLLHYLTAALLVQFDNHYPTKQVPTLFGPALGVFKQLRRKCCRLNEFC